MIVEELTATLGLEVDSSGFVKAAELFASLKGGLLAFGTAVGGTLVAFAAIAKSTANTGDHFRKLSQSVGVDSDALQELAYSAELADVSTEELAQSLGMLAKGGAADPKQALFDLADQFSKMPDGGEKTRIALEKLGRAGKQMIPLLNEGSASLKAMGAEARLMGIVMSKEDLKAAEDFNDALTKLQKRFEGFRNRIGGQLLRPLTRLVDAFGEWADGLSKNTELLNTLEKAVRVLAASLATALVTQLFAAGAAALTAAGGFGALATSMLTAAGRFAAFGLVLALAGLIVEDIWGFFEGKDSIMGDWIKFLDAFTKPQEGDHWLLAILREAVRFITDIQGGIERVGRALSGMIKPGSFPDFILKTVTGEAGDSAVPRAVAAPFGGGASPLQSVMSSPSASQSKPVVAPNMSTNITINAAPGMDEEALVSKAQQAFERSHEAEMRRLASGLE